MSDLISRSKVIAVLEKLEEHSLTGKMDISNAIYLLNNQPTAYDIDKVVEELKTIKEDALAEYNMAEYNLDNNIGNSVAENYRKDMNEGKCFALEDAFALEYAIEIVKQGGVSDNVCEWKIDGVYLNSPHIQPFVTCIADDEDYRYNYCPVCGKKIKAVE